MAAMNRSHSSACGWDRVGNQLQPGRQEQGGEQRGSGVQPGSGAGYTPAERDAANYNAHGIADWSMGIIEIPELSDAA
jgi:hypothetical protein